MAEPRPDASDLLLLARRAYPGLRPTGLCSRLHHGPGDSPYDCSTCFPDLPALLATHNRLKQEAWRRLRQLGVDIPDDPHRLHHCRSCGRSFYLLGRPVLDRKCGWCHRRDGTQEFVEGAQRQDLHSEITRLRGVMAAALERVEVDDADEARAILAGEVSLDGTPVDHRRRRA